MTPTTALQMYRRSFQGHFLWVGSRWRRITEFMRWLGPRDPDGKRQPVPRAGRITGRRLPRLASGRMSWKHSSPS